MPPSIKETVPEFILADTNGDKHALQPTSAPATVVVFSCNHCPYALAWHAQINDVVRDYAQQGVRFLQVNANDAEHYPADSVENMRTRVVAGEPVPARRLPGHRRTVQLTALTSSPS